MNVISPCCGVCFEQPANFANNVVLPGAAGKPLGFLMYPQAETANGRLDSLDPVAFAYQITSREIA